MKSTETEKPDLERIQKGEGNEILQESNQGDDLISSVSNNNKESGCNGQDQEQSSPERKKRGKKPRSKRNRKRPRSEVHSNDDLKIESTVKRLEMNGKPILEAGSEQFIRVIHPYPYTFSTHAKKRWIGRTLLDIYGDEFGSYPVVRRSAYIQFVNELNLFALFCIVFRTSHSHLYFSKTYVELLRNSNPTR